LRRRIDRIALFSRRLVRWRDADGLHGLRVLLLNLATQAVLSARWQAGRLHDEAVLVDHHLVAGRQHGVADRHAVHAGEFAMAERAQYHAVAVQFELALALRQRRIVDADVATGTAPDHLWFGQGEAAAAQ